MQQDIIDTLFCDRAKLSHLISQLAPRTPDEARQLQDLMQRRDRLWMAIGDLINCDITSRTAGIKNAREQLDAASAELAKLAGSFTDAAQAIALVDQLVTVVAAVGTAATTGGSRI